MPFLSDLHFAYDATRTGDEVLVIESVQGMHGRGKRFQITVNNNAPRAGFSMFAACEREWSAASCWVVRGAPRIEIRPAALLDGQLTCSMSDTGRVQRLTRFPAWEHAAYRSPSPSEYTAVFHTDFAIAYPSVRVVALAIEAHYRASG